MENITYILDEFCGSQFWDSNLTWYTKDPDLTPCFEKTALLWLPGLVLFILLPLECSRINNSKAKHIPWSWLNISKVVVLGLLMAVSVANLTYIAHRGHSYPAGIVAPIFQFVIFSTIMVVVLLNKTQGLQVSYLLFFISLLMVLCQTPQIYSFLKSYYTSGSIDDITVRSLIVAVYLLQCAFFVLQFFCDIPPIYSEYPNLEHPSPEGSASVPSRLTFVWFTPLIQLGSKKPLEPSDVFNLDHENSSKIIVPNFDKHWMTTLQNKQKPEVSYDNHCMKVGFHQTQKPNASLLPALCKTFGPTLLMGSALKFFQDLVLFVNPQLLKLVISFVSSDESLWKGCMYAVLMLISSIIQMFLLNRYFLTMNFLGCRISTALTATIYRKSLRLSNAARKQSTLGEVVNLMAVDAQSFRQIMTSLNMVWSAPLQISLALYFLWNILGPAVLAGLAVMVLMLPINVWMVRQNRRLRIKQMKFKDERIKTMNEVLAGVKVLKLYAWESSFERKINKIRQKEINVLKTAAYFNTVSSFLFSSTPYMVALASFSCFVLSDERNILDAETAFVSLSLFNILRFPLNMLPQVMNNIVMVAVSLKRMNKFLNNNELDPHAVDHDSSEKDAIVVENGTFSWDSSDDSNIVLRNINLTIPQNALVAVVGTVGSGKSSLVSAILGEMDKLSGKVNTKGNIAYVPQLAWIQNATLRKNITCVQEYDKTSFRRVIKACALEQDIEILPGGEMTEIGEKGINLSGGQKQRISLARAVYSNADLYLLDDPLSAVDSHVGKHIFESVIGPKGILRNKTRVLVTHGVTFLPETDFIIVMKDGQVSESGTFKQLVANKGAFADFLLQYLERAETDDDMELELEGMKEDLMKNESLRDKYIRAISVKSEVSAKSNSLPRKSSMDSNCSRQEGSKTSIDKEVLDEPKRKEKKIMTVEEAETGNVKLSVYMYYFQAIGLATALLTLAGIIMYQAFQVSTNIWLSKWSSDSTAVINGTQDSDKTHFYLSVYGALGVGQAFFNVVGNVTMSLGCLLAAAWLHGNMLHRILRSPMSFFDTTPLGRIINRFSKDIDMCDTVLSFNLSAFLSMAVQVVSTVLVIVYSTPMFIVVIIPIMIFSVLLQRFFVATSRQLKRLESTSRSPIYSHFGETLQGAQSIRAYNMQEVFISQSDLHVDTNQTYNFPNMISMRWLAIRLESVCNLIVFFAALFVVLYRDSLDTGLAGLSISYALQITQVVNFFVRTASDVETNIVAVERIKEYTDIRQEAPWTVEPKPDALWPKKGKIEFQDYKVRYRNGLDLVLGGVSFSIQPGEKVGIVGRTGAGKSSLTLALFRILEAAGGSIYIDGINIASVGLHDLRARLTIIPQDPVLFSGTLRNNLDPFEKESDEKLWKALEMSNLKPFVKTLPTGLNHPITEGGENLSVGQKQLICLSRALLRKTKVLILDEATASVDLETDDIIQRSIRTEFEGCTVLTIAHRLNTIMDYDRILVLDRGMMKEFDSPNTLLQDPSTIFYNMAKDAGLVS